MCPMDFRGTKHFQQANVDRAADTETVILFGGNIGEFKRQEVEALKTVVLDESNHRSIDRKNALEKLQRWSDQGSKFAAAALREMGVGSAVLSDHEFERALKNLRLDDKNKAQVRSFGKDFFRFASSLANPQTAEDKLNLADLADRSGREVAATFVASANDAAIEAVNREFTLAKPNYYLCEENFDAIVDCLSRRYLGHGSDNYDEGQLMQDLFIDGYWTANNLQAAYEELNAAGLLEVAPGKARPINADDRQALSIAAAAITTERDLDRVLNGYLQFSLGDSAPRNWKLVVGKVQYAAVLFDAVLFAWSQKRADYEPSNGAELYIRKYLAGRFPTFPLLTAAWNKCVNETGGRGIIPIEEEMLDEEALQAEASFADINARYAVRS
jgi:hypothetical protein